jgi:hypothetical protein
MPGRARGGGGQECFVRPLLREASPCGTVAAMKQHVIDEVLAREVASAVLADVRTVRRVLRGESVRGLVGARIRAELARRLAADAEPVVRPSEARPEPGSAQPEKE